MGEAKENTGERGRDDPGCELWRGPRDVLMSVLYDPGARGLTEAYGPVPEPGFDGTEWDVRACTAPPAEALATLGERPREDISSSCAVACCCRSTHLDAAIVELTAVIEQCVRLGARCLSVTPPPIVGAGGVAGAGICETDPLSGFGGYQDHLNFTAALLHELRLLAGSSGVALAIEPAVGGGLMSPVELRELIDGAYSGSVGVSLDISRLAQFGSAADWVETLRHRVLTLRLPRGATPNDTVEPVFAALTQTRYDGTLICPNTDLLGRCRDVMREA